MDKMEPAAPNTTRCPAKSPSAPICLAMMCGRYRAGSADTQVERYQRNAPQACRNQQGQEQKRPQKQLCENASDNFLAIGTHGAKLSEAPSRIRAIGVAQEARSEMNF